MSSLGISIICSTNKSHQMKNILENFHRQNIKNKELIVILNYINPDMSIWNTKIDDFDNITIYCMHPNISLGSCLNHAISKSKYPIIAKFDDDDYYGSKYLEKSVEYFNSTDADVIGKASTYIYFKEYGILGIKYENHEDMFINRVEGGTLIFKRYVFDKVKFKEKNLGEDVEFCKDCLRQGYKIYSTNKNNYVYIRNESKYHTWKINNDKLIKECQILGNPISFEELIISSKINS